MKRTKEKLQIHVGDTLEDTGRRFVGAWHALEQGKRVRERHLSFESLEGLLSLLTPKRWELLKHVHRSPVRSIRALALELNRDYRRVHDDVEALAGAGLMQRDGRVVRADYDAIESSFRFEKTRAGQAESTGVGRIA
jgi:predicted transcriptional regulator